MTNQEHFKKLNIGWIPYWNLHPFRQELESFQDDERTMNLLDGVPSFVNHALGKGQVSIAPCSSVCLMTNWDHEMVIPLGVSCDGAVQSVYWGLLPEHGKIYEHIQTRQTLVRQLVEDARLKSGGDFRMMAQIIEEKSNQLPSIACELIPSLSISSASATSAMLTRIFYKLWFGPKAYQIMESQGFASLYPETPPIQLIIGDDALTQKTSFYQTIDLGTAWRDITGLPFVYAVWQSKGAFLNGWRRLIVEIGERAEAKMKVSPQTYLPDPSPLDKKGQPIPLQKYWQNLSYRLGPREFRGLLLFLNLTKFHMKTSPDKRSLVKLLRWQEMSQKPKIELSY